MYLSVVTLGAAGIAAGVDWWAVAHDLRRVEVWAKPAAMALLVIVAATAGSPLDRVRIALVVGALFGLVGDVALLGDGDAAFMGGLGAFAVGHLAYTVAALAVGFHAPYLVPGLILVALLMGFRFVSQILPGARRFGGAVLAGAVAFYAVVISLMSVTAWTSGAVVAGCGAALFALSDWLIGYQRFVAPLPNGRLAIIVPYHVGQAMLIVGLATA